jgi:hypothetical protein
VFESNDIYKSLSKVDLDRHGECRSTCKDLGMELRTLKERILTVMKTAFTRKAERENPSQQLCHKLGI